MLLTTEFLGLSTELVLWFSLLDFPHKPLDVGYVTFHIKFPFAPFEVHVSYLPENRSLSPSLNFQGGEKKKKTVRKILMLRNELILAP